MSGISSTFQSHAHGLPQSEEPRPVPTRTGSSLSLPDAMKLAIEKAKVFEGATAPNPPVGAVALDENGNLLASGAHERAGGPHAEVRVIEACKELGLEKNIHTLVVTLEPCHHFGRTPPCTESIINMEIPRVVFGTLDPNPKVAGHGRERLQESGIEVLAGILQDDCQELIRSFKKWSTRGLPWVTLKTAVRPNGSMVPPAGKKTFTSKESLVYAHKLRKRADAILTGSGTVLADRPELTVRHVLDHPDKKRHLVVMDRRGRTPTDWIERAQSRGFEVSIATDLRRILTSLASQGVLEVLVEAGPTLFKTILAEGLWDEHVLIRQGENDQPDQIETRFKPEGIE